MVSCLGEDVAESEHRYDDLSDDDPLRDIKDIAFAQAYLEKVRWVNAREGVMTCACLNFGHFLFLRSPTPFLEIYLPEDVSHLPVEVLEQIKNRCDRFRSEMILKPAGR